MKKIISVSLHEDTIQKLLDRLQDNRTYRNKSHLVEIAIERFLEG